MERVVRAHSGAALRFFQPSGGFSVDRVPRPYFVPQPFVDCLSSESSPRKDRGPLSRPPAPLQLFTILQNAPPATLSPEVSPTPTLLAQLPGSPPNYGFPFHESEDPLPGCPGSPTEGSSLPPALPASKLSSLHESVRTVRASPNLVAVTLLSFCPSKDLIAQTLEPLPRLNPCESKRLPSPGESGNATSGTESTPADQVKPPQYSETLAQLLRQSPALFRAGPHRPSAASPPPLTFHLRSPASPAFGVSQSLGN